jgi:hypothetical protein
VSSETNRSHDLRRLLEELVAGDLGLEDALQKLRLLQVTQLGEFARLDVNRDLRKGVPEVIYAPRKRDADLESIVRQFLEERGLALASRLDPERAERLRLALTGTSQGARALGESRAAGDDTRAPVSDLTFDYDQVASVLAYPIVSCARARRVCGSADGWDLGHPGG